MQSQTADSAPALQVACCRLANRLEYAPPCEIGTATWRVTLSICLFAQLTPNFWPLCANTTLSTNRKCIPYRDGAKGGARSDGRRQHAQKMGKDRTCSSRDMLADRQTDAHINRHGHHTTSPPYWGRRGNLVTCGLCRRVICGPTHGVKHATDQVGPD